MSATTRTAGIGKPMIVLPLFWDQHDNAQRMQELGLGARLDSYRFTDSEMHAALGRLLAGASLRGRLADAAATVQRRGGVRAAAGLIEQAVDA